MESQGEGGESAKGDEWIKGPKGKKKRDGDRVWCELSGREGWIQQRKKNKDMHVKRSKESPMDKDTSRGLAFVEFCSRITQKASSHATTSLSLALVLPSLSLALHCQWFKERTGTKKLGEL